MSWFDRIFTKATDRPTAVSVDTTDIEEAAWSVEVVNALRDDYHQLAVPYCDNPVVRAAIEAMRRNATKAVLQVGRFDDDGGFDAEDHPLTELWKRPAPGENDGTLIEHIYCGLLGNGDAPIGGNAYVQIITDRDGDTGGTVKELQPIPSAWIQNPVMSRESLGKIDLYRYMGADYGRVYNEEIPPDRMIHIKQGRSTLSMAFGRSPLDAVVPDLALIKLVSLYETTVLSRSGVPSWIISLMGAHAQTYGRDQIATLQSDFKRAVSGKAVGRPIVVKGEMKLDTPGFSPKDLMIAEATMISVARVCGVLGWAPMSIKQPDTGKTYSNLVEANKASWRDAVIPFLEQVASALTHLVRTMPIGYGDVVMPPDPTLAVRFDTSQIEELAVDAKEVAARSMLLWNNGDGIIDDNEARAVNGFAEWTEEQLAARAERQAEKDKMAAQDPASKDKPSAES